MSLPVTFVLGLFLSVGSARCQIPSFTRAFFPIQDENLAQACQAALLLAPEQTAALQKAWQSSWREILLIGKSNSATKNQEIIEVRKKFEQKRDEILSSAQRDTVLLIGDICTSAYKTVSTDFQAQIDAAFLESEKNRLIGERNIAFSAACLSELKNSLSGDRLAMFQATLSKK